MSMKHIQEGFEGRSIQRYELKCGILRYVRNGCEYVYLADPAKFEAVRQEERKAEEARRREQRAQQIAEQQEQAYYGKVHAAG